MFGTTVALPSESKAVSLYGPSTVCHMALVYVDCLRAWASRNFSTAKHAVLVAAAPYAPEAQCPEPAAAEVDVLSQASGIEVSSDR